jgi:tetratricopeptide (TPR) repeat protein
LIESFLEKFFSRLDDNTRMKISFVLLLAVLPASLVSAAAPSLQEFERHITSELQAQSPQAVPLFQEASQARDKGDFKRAAELLTQVETLAPKFSHAYRRHAHAALELQDFETARRLIRQAVQLDESGLNQVMLGVVLMADREQRSKLLGEALDVTRRGRLQALDDVTVQGMAGQVALEAGDAELLRSATVQLERLDPDGAATLLDRAILLAMQGDFNDALEKLDSAHAHGLPDDVYRELRGRMRQERPFYQQVGPVAWRVVVAWLAGMAILFVLGLVLSAITLRASARPPSQQQAHARGHEALLRRVYATVLWLCCAYYYVSIPFALAAVVLGGGGLIYAFFAIGHIPIKLVVIIGGVVLVSVFATLKSLFVRGSNEAPGKPLALEEHPQLRATSTKWRGAWAPVRSTPSTSRPAPKSPSPSAAG